MLSLVYQTPSNKLSAFRLTKNSKRNLIAVKLARKVSEMPNHSTRNSWNSGRKRKWNGICGQKISEDFCPIFRKFLIMLILSVECELSAGKFRICSSKNPLSSLCCNMGVCSICGLAWSSCLILVRVCIFGTFKRRMHSWLERKEQPRKRYLTCEDFLKESLFYLTSISESLEVFVLVAVWEFCYFRSLQNVKNLRTI